MAADHCHSTKQVHVCAHLRPVSECLHRNYIQMGMRQSYDQANAQRKVPRALKIAASRLCAPEACELSNANSLQLDVHWNKFLRAQMGK